MQGIPFISFTLCPPFPLKNQQTVTHPPLFHPHHSLVLVYDVDYDCNCNCNCNCNCDCDCDPDSKQAKMIGGIVPKLTSSSCSSFPLETLSSPIPIPIHIPIPIPIPNNKLGFLNFKPQRLLQMKANSNVDDDILTNGHPPISSSSAGKHISQLSTIGDSTNIHWHSCSVEKDDRQKLLDQKGWVIWITGLSGSGKSTMACALNRILHQRGKLSYVLDGDNVRHGLNKDLGFNAEDRAENIRRVGEVAKLFADAGVICIASLISPYRRDRDACRALLPNGDFIEVFMDVPLHICESRDPKGLYKLARAGKIKGFTGIDDPYEAPINSEIVLKHGEPCASPSEMAEKVVVYLEDKGYLQA